MHRLSYRQIADDIAPRDPRGEYEPGSRLPSYAQLADIYDVSYSTAARAVRVLRARFDLWRARARPVC